MEERDFPAVADSLHDLRWWTNRLLWREGVRDPMQATAVLVASEVATQVLQRMRPQAETFTARLHVDPVWIVVSARCAAEDLTRDATVIPAEQRQLHTSLLDAFSNQHCWLSTGTHRIRRAEIQWHRPAPQREATVVALNTAPEAQPALPRARPTRRVRHDSPSRGRPR